MVPEITPFVLLRECDLTLSKAIGTGYTVEETAADIDKIFKKRLNKSYHNTRNQNTRDFIKNGNFAIVHISEANAQLIEKFPMFAIKRTIVKFAAHALVKKVHENEKDDLMKPPVRAIMNFLLKLLIFRTPYILLKIKMKTLISQ